jgi:hypothetical protein
LLTGCLMAAAPLAAANPPVDRPQCNTAMTASDAVFCEGYYALCIKALCRPTADPTKVECACNVEQGWSMGPAQCSAVGRSANKPLPGGPIMSTYSNAFDVKEQTLTCSSDSTQWAWCYGAPCKVGAKGAGATCLCPVCTGAASTLGGNCNQANCAKVWSAATPANDKAASALFFEHMKKQGVTVPPPAAACPNTTPAH